MREMHKNNNVLMYDDDARTGKQILVYATSIRSKSDVREVKELLRDIPGLASWNVDLEDWEKVLRIECSGLSASFFIDLLSGNGFFIKELP